MNTYDIFKEGYKKLKNNFIDIISINIIVFGILRLIYYGIISLEYRVNYFERIGFKLGIFLSILILASPLYLYGLLNYVFHIYKNSSLINKMFEFTRNPKIYFKSLCITMKVAAEVAIKGAIAYAISKIGYILYVSNFGVLTHRYNTLFTLFVIIIILEEMIRRLFKLSPTIMYYVMNKDFSLQTISSRGKLYYKANKEIINSVFFWLNAMFFITLIINTLIYNGLGKDIGSILVLITFSLVASYTETTYIHLMEELKKYE